MQVKRILTNPFRFLLITLALVLWTGGSASALDIYIDDEYIACGSSVTVEIKVSDFDDLSGLQFSLHFNPDVIEYQSGTGQFPEGFSAIGDNNSGDGILTFSWVNGNAIDLADGYVIFTLEFLHTGNCQSATELTFSDDPTPIEATDGDFNLVPVNTQNGQVIVVNNPCGIVLDAGPDQSICAPGGSVQLMGSVNDSVLSFNWSPAGLLDNPNILNPSATVTETTTFTLEGTGEGSNLIQNWDFSQDTTGFWSEYMYSPGNLADPGTYDVVESPATVHPAFEDCDDHTPGPDEHMMVINGAQEANINIWCQTIDDIEPETEYEFSAWVGSAYPVNPAELQFSINGELLGDVFEASGTPCEWEEFFETWNSGSATSATICIVNQNTAFSGNDFALDDISFRPVCTVADEVTVEVLEPAEEIIDTTICEGSSVEINGETLNEADTYEFILEASNGCDSILTVHLGVIAPEAVVEPAELITCAQEIVTLDGSPSTGGNPLEYQWETLNGNFVGMPDGPMVEVDAPGTYTLVVTAESNGMLCSSPPFEITVMADTVAPVVSIEPPDSLECPPDSVTINASIDQSQGTTSVHWSTANGNIVSGSNSLYPEVDAPGTYTLSVIQNGNGCTATATVQVFSDTAAANARVVEPDTLNCSTQTVSLDGSQSTPSDASFQWSTANGFISSDPQQAVIEADSPGTYRLIVESENNCRDTAYVDVLQDRDPPIFQLSGPQALTCDQETGIIVIDQYTDLPPLEVEWNSPDGSIVQTYDSLIHIQSGGTYTASVVSMENGCMFSDTIMVDENTEPPTFAFEPVDSLGCAGDTVEIYTNEQSPEYEYAWSSSGGSIISSPLGTSVAVDASAWYTLEVIDPENGCSAIDSVFVPSSDDAVSFDLNASGTVISCYHPEVTLFLEGINGGNELELEGTGPGGQPVFTNNDSTATVNKAGTYTVTLKDPSSGCQSSRSIFIDSNFVQPTAIAGTDDTLNCQVTTIQLDGSGSQGSGLQYEWYMESVMGDPISNTATAHIQTDGPFILLVRDTSSGCADRDTVQIVKGQDIPGISIDAPGQITCEDSVIILDASGSDQDSMLQSYWNTIDGTFQGDSTGYMLKVTGAGSYVFILEDNATNCIASDTIEVSSDTTAPRAQLPHGDTLNCIRQEVELTAQPDSPGNYTFEWSSGPGGNIIGASGGQSITVDSESMYFVRITDESNGCSDVFSTQLTRDTTRPDADAGNDKQIPCDADEVMLNGSESSIGNKISYQWTHGDGMFIEDAGKMRPAVQHTGWYVLEVVNSRNGCSAIDSTFVSRATAKPVSFEVLHARCASGGSFHLNPQEIHDSSTAVIPSLGPISFGQTVENLMPGIYDLRVRDKNGCVTDTSFTISGGGGFELNLPPSLTVSAGDTVRLDPQLDLPDSLIATVQWSPSSLISCDSCLRPLIQPQEDVVISLEITDLYGCTEKTNIEIRVRREQSVYVPNAFTPDKDGINEVFTVYGKQYIRTIRAMEIFNRWGDRIYSVRNIDPFSASAQWDGTYKGKTMDPGVFVYRLTVVFHNGSVRTYSGDVSLIR